MQKAQQDRVQISWDAMCYCAWVKEILYDEQIFIFNIYIQCNTHSIKISLKFPPRCPVDNLSELNPVVAII